MRFTLLSLMFAVAAIAALLAVTRTPESMVLLGIWLMHSVVAVILSAPVVYFGRRRVHWSLWDVSALVLPFGVWTGLIFSDAAIGKTLANLIEPVYFSVAIPIAALLRVIAGTRAPERVCSIALVVLLCLTAVCVFWWTPPLPE